MFRLSLNKRNRSVNRREKPSAKGHLSSVLAAGAASRSAERDWGRVRINVVVCLFCLFWLGLWGRAWYLQMVEGPRLAEQARRQHVTSELVSGQRGMIFDRNGQVLAQSVEARSVYARPQEIEDFLSMANVLGPVLGLEPQKLYDDLSRSKKRFVWLKRKVDDRTAEAVRRARIVGIGLSREYDRIYPFKHMAGQLLGFVGLDDKGLEGLERSMDARLGSIPTRQIVQRDARGRRFYLHEEGGSEPRGEDLTLTIDVQMQFIAEEAVAQAALENKARWSGALVVDVPTGEILAWAQYPFFNPNTYRNFSPQIYRNRLAADALEPGSTFKPLVMAAALQEGKVTPDTLIDCEGGKWESDNIVIRDTSSRDILPASKVLRYSSNIGMAKIGQSMGAPLFHRYLQALGFGDYTSVPVADSRGILRAPRDWSKVDIMSTSFGQSISVTGLQMAQAYLTLLNHGVYKPLRLIMEDTHVEETHRRIFSERTVRQVMDMMRDVVEAGDGTGRRARVAGVDVAGKTGTAQKADHKTGTYGDKRLASFVGFLPAEEPRYLILVMVDEPTRNQYGGLVAAPVFQEIATRSLTYAGALAEVQTGSTSAVNQKQHRRGLKLSGLTAPYQTQKPEIVRRGPSMQLPGYLAKAGSQVPDVMGKSVRNAVELFARAGIVPELKGSGDRVIRQSPPPGSAWPDEGTQVEYILWLSER
ncbi:MAG: transpeptidase family protein [Desulfovibrio sp.]|nr:transpeptidase family protein [Desulfovibrio sp.]